MIRCLLIITLVLVSITTNAQKRRKFGTVTKQELESKSYDADTTAKAVVLYDYGETKVNIVDNSFQVEFTYHVIIKFYDDDELDRANISVSHHKNASFSKFKAATYNLEDGEIIETKISKKDIHSEKLVDEIFEKKFSFSDVEPGSIIEYTYQKNSGSVLFLNSWYFQSSLPVAHSEYVVSYPYYLNYKTISSGYTPLQIVDVSDINISVQHDVVRGKKHRFVAKKVPAFVSEKYMTARSNFLTGIEFELKSIDMPGYSREIFSDFNGIQKMLMTSEDFGLRLNKVGFEKETIDNLKLANSDKLSLAKAIYEYVQNNTSWDETNSIYASESFKKLREEDTNSGMINLYLVALLQKAGLNANPVIMSTRSNGTVHPYYPLLKSYNYVIANVIIDDVNYLLDGTDDYLPFGVLPERCLNGKGRLINERTNYWVDIKSLSIRKTLCSGIFEIDEFGELEGSLNYSIQGYKGYNLKKEIDKTGKEELLEEYAERDGWEIESSTISGEDKIDAPLKIDFDLAISDKVDVAGDRIYFTPLVVGQTKSNPFKLDKRKYPVDFTCGRATTYMIKYKIPEGYEVESIPKALAMALPEKGGKYLYSVNVLNETISVTVQYKLNKVVFLPSEYDLLKQYFSQIVNKESEQIVLKSKI